MQVSIRRFSLPLRAPLETAGGRIERRTGALVHVEGEGGDYGVGEATPFPGWTEEPEECVARLEDAATRLETDGPDDALEVIADHPAARHGLSLALADRSARARDRPLYRHLGGRERVDAVPVNAVIGDGDVAEPVAAAREAAAAGFTCLKVKVGRRTVAADVDRLAAVRDAVGRDVSLRADANGAWTASAARSAFEAFADLGITYVEQPLDPTDLDGLRALRGGPVAVAVDETLAAVATETVIDEGVADLLVVKPMVQGGLDRARETVDRANAAGLGAVVTNTVDGAVARAGAVHLVASLEDPAPAGLATADRLAEDVADDPIRLADGSASVPTSPGHGVSVSGWSS